LPGFALLEFVFEFPSFGKEKNNAEQTDQIEDIFEYLRLISVKGIQGFSHAEAVSALKNRKFNRNNPLLNPEAVALPHNFLISPMKDHPVAPVPGINKNRLILIDRELPDTFTR
jgi:hypothetical protein